MTRTCRKVAELLIDFVDVVVHVFQEEWRGVYDLDNRVLPAHGDALKQVVRRNVCERCRHLGSTEPTGVIAPARKCSVQL